MHVFTRVSQTSFMLCLLQRCILQFTLSSLLFMFVFGVWLVMLCTMHVGACSCRWWTLIEMVVIGVGAALAEVRMDRC